MPQPVANGNEVYGLNKVYSFAVDQRGPEPVDPHRHRAADAKLTGPATAEGGATVLLSGKNSNNGGGKLTYLWKLPAGITAPVNQADLSFVAPKLSQDKAYTFGLTVTNEKGSSSAEHTVTVRSRTRAAAAPAAASTGLQGRHGLQGRRTRQQRWPGLRVQAVALHQLVRPVGAVLRAGHGPELVGSLDRREVRR